MAKSKTQAGLGGSKQRELAKKREERKAEIQAELDAKNEQLSANFSAENNSAGKASSIADETSHQARSTTPTVGKTIEFGYVPSAKIRTWDLKDRTEEELEDDPDWIELVPDVELNGVLTTVVLRILDGPDENGCEYEEIAGFKRVTAAKLFGYDVPAQIMEMTDDEALILQRSENKGRSNPSFWSRAKLLSKIFERQDLEHLKEFQKGERAGFNPSQTSTAKRALGLFSDRLRSSVRLHQLSSLSILEMVQFLESDDGDFDFREQALIEHAREINSKPKDCQKLVSRIAKNFGRSQSPKKTDTKTVFVSEAGKPLVSFKSKARGYSIDIDDAVKDLVSMSDLEGVLLKFLKGKGIKLGKREGEEK